MGFCLINKSQNKICKISKVFIGKCFRKENYLPNIISAIIEYVFNIHFEIITIKVNSGQHEMIKAINNQGAKLKCE